MCEIPHIPTTEPSVAQSEQPATRSGQTSTPPAQPVELSGENKIFSRQINAYNGALVFFSIIMGIIVGTLGSMWITYAPEVVNIDKSFWFWSSFVGFWGLLLALVCIFLYLRKKAF
jgi:hypothetical protein